MKHVVASLTIGACLLLPSAGVVLAANRHLSNPSTVSGTGKGQPGSNHGTSCNTGSVGPGPGGSVSASNPSGTNGSPFNQAIAKTYAGNPGNPTGPGGTANANPAAVSQYDVACFQAP
jgi:hypothetical protein